MLNVMEPVRSTSAQRWLMMFIDQRYSRSVDDLTAIPKSKVTLIPKFFGDGRGLKVDPNDERAVQAVLESVRCLPVLFGTRVHVSDAFSMSLEPRSRVFDCSEGVDNFGLVYGPIPRYPWYVWASAVEGYLRQLMHGRVNNMALLEYEGQPGVLITTFSGETALFLPGRAISPFPVRTDIDIFPVRPVVERRSWQGLTRPLPVCTVHGRTLSRIHYPVIYSGLVVAISMWLALKDDVKTLPLYGGNSCIVWPVNGLLYLQTTEQGAFETRMFIRSLCDYSLVVDTELGIIRSANYVPDPDELRNALGVPVELQSASRFVPVTDALAADVLGTVSGLGLSLRGHSWLTAIAERVINAVQGVISE